MDFVIEGQGDEKRVVLSGALTFVDNQKFKQLMASLEENPAKAVTLDFTAVEFIDSGALGMLLLFCEQCQSKNISLSLHAPQGQVKKIFMLSKFDQLFSMQKTG